MQAEVWVFSGAKDSKAKYLSNFTHGGDFVVQLGPGAMTFASIELAYHAHKMMHLIGGARPDLAQKFSIVGEYGRLQGAAQKKPGGKAAFKALGIALDVKAWNAAAGSIMEKLVAARADVDAKYIAIAKEFVSSGKIIRHFARGVFYRSKDTGALVGHDMLGPLLMKLGGN